MATAISPFGDQEMTTYSLDMTTISMAEHPDPCTQLGGTVYMFLAGLVIVIINILVAIDTISNITLR